MPDIDNRSPTRQAEPGGLESAAFGAFAASACCAAFSLPLGRALLAVSLGLAIVDRARRRASWSLPPVAWLWLAFCAWAVVATIWGLHPALGVPRLTKLLWFAGIVVGAWLVTTPTRLANCLGGYAVGSAGLALFMLGRQPWVAWRDVRMGTEPTFVAALAHTGSMTDAQRFMVGLLLALAFVLAARRAAVRPRLWWGVLSLTGLGLVLSGKRGSWAAGLAAIGLLVVWRAGWRARLALAAAVALALLLPPVQTRLREATREFDVSRGGRLAMWTQVAPVLVRAHPWKGVGYRSLTPEDLQHIDAHIERNRDHLHSNPVDVLVATGAVGFVIYVAWMGWALADAGRVARRTRRVAGPEGTLAATLRLALVALLLNGLVEFNFGDAKIVLLYGLLIGCAAGMRRQDAG